MSRDPRQRSDRDRRGRGRPRGRRPEEAGPIWARPEPGTRRPRFTRELIAEKALEIADAEGFDAVSMRRLAAELGAGTMTLYHYVRTKEELVELMDDAIMGEVVVPDEELSGDWREAISQVARASLGAFNRHPWAFEALRGARFGPNGMRHFEQSLKAVSSLKASDTDRLEVITLVDDYVFGYVLRWSRASANFPGDETMESMIAYVTEQVATADYPHARAFLDFDKDPHGSWERAEQIMRDPERFERGLQRLLDGVELDLTGRRRRR